jgi:hypothetical protein
MDTKIFLSRGKHLLFYAVFILLTFPALLHAEVAGPGWHLADVEPVTPWSTPPQTAIEQLAVSPYFETLAGGEAATGLTPELVELARALQHDPKLRREQCLLTYLDSSGNGFDTRRHFSSRFSGRVVLWLNLSMEK